tara:strand:+ start:67 stop:690 length:624 start_codon:yes stop_codon:yes gene_type:complete
LLKRTSLKIINNQLKGKKNLKILDIGCGYRANENATVIADKKDFSNFYKSRKFIQINSKTLPFKDKEFDFVIASHVIEHVDDFEFFIKEIERISPKGYIELPTRLGDNLVFENENDHIWWFLFDDEKNKLIVSKKNQLIEPFLNVSTSKLLEENYKESLVLELFWEDKIEYEINDSIRHEGFNKISFLKLIKKYFSKRIRTLLKKSS